MSPPGSGLVSSFDSHAGGKSPKLFPDAEQPIVDLRRRFFSHALNFQPAQHFKIHLLRDALFAAHPVNRHRGGNAEHRCQRQQCRIAVAVHEAHELLKQGIRAGGHLFVEKIMPDVGGQLFDAAIAFRRIDGAGFLDDRPQRWGDPQSGVERRGGFKFARADSGDHLLEISAGDRAAQCGDLVEDHAEGENVGLLRGGAVPKCFRGDIGGRSVEMAFAVGPFRAGDAPVHYIDFAVTAEHDVFRLQIAVDDSSAVAVFDRIANPEKTFEPYLKRAFVTPVAGRFLPLPFAAAFQILFQSNAVDKLHRQMETVRAVGVEAVQGNDRRMVELGIELGFRDEFPDAFRPGKMFFLQGLDDDLPAENQILRQKNPPESALRDQFQDFVPAAALFQHAAEFNRGIGGKIHRFNRLVGTADDIAQMGAGITGGGVFPLFVHNLREINIVRRSRWLHVLPPDISVRLSSGLCGRKNLRNPLFHGVAGLRDAVA